MHVRSVRARRSCTLHTAHCTLHIAHYTLHTAHCTLHAANSRLASHCSLHTAHSRLHTPGYTRHTAPWHISQWGHVAHPFLARINVWPSQWDSIDQMPSTHYRRGKSSRVQYSAVQFITVYLAQFSTSEYRTLVQSYQLAGVIRTWLLLGSKLASHCTVV